MDKLSSPLSEDLCEPVNIGADAYVSEAFARAEPNHIWRKVWQIACRVEELPDVGDYVVYDIVDDTILVTRSAPDKISAFYNVCAHRGKRLADGCGHTKGFRCSYHAWRYDLEGKNTFVLDQEDWGGALKQDRLNLPTVKVDTWGGFVWVNMDPDSVSLAEYLAPAAGMMDPFQLEKMRFRWRKWTIFPSNWKVALEAFMEPYHVEGTHPQLISFADFYAWSKAQGLHSNSGYGERRSSTDSKELDAAFSNTLTRTGKGTDARTSIAKLQKEIWDTTDCTTTQTIVDAAQRLPDELPEGTPADEVMAHWLASARRDDAAKGVIWPTIDPAHIAKSGSSWHVFPNIQLSPGLTNCLGYRVRPNGLDPHSCIFETFVLELYPEGQEPQTEWVHADYVKDRDLWPPVLLQDFDNMGDVQRGMRSAGFRSAIPNPHQERKIANFHRRLAEFMGTAPPQPLIED